MPLGHILPESTDTCTDTVRVFCCPALSHRELYQGLRDKTMVCPCAFIPSFPESGDVVN